MDTADQIRERRRIYNKRYYDNHRDFCINLCKKYYRDNIDDRKQYAKEYYKQKKYNASINESANAQNQQTTPA